MKRVFTIAAAMAALASCGGGGGGDGTVVVPQEEPPQTLYIVGSGTSVGNDLPDSLRQAWPRLLFAEAFPRSTILVNGATGPSTVARALVEQLPLAQELRPQTVVVFVGSYDLNQGTPVSAFGDQLRELLDDLVATGATRVFVANIPRLPAYDEVLRRAYNIAIAAAAKASNAMLVDIADLVLDAVDQDAGYQPDVEGHRAIADAFADAIRSSASG